MTGASDITVTGTCETVHPALEVAAGAISARIDAGALRGVAIGDLELVRQIDFPVRDENWSSLPPRVVYEDLERSGNGFRYEYHFEVADGALLCRVVYTATSDGLIVAEGEAKARRDFVTNRTGFTVLHPILGFAGRPAIVRDPAGKARKTVLPDRIMPSQPIKDIAGLAFELCGLTMTMAFEGEVFEMEDQRNWSDASFKTYCRPLVEPFAYRIASNETLRQKIRIRINGTRVAPAARPATALDIGERLDEPFPELLMAADDGWFAEAGALAALGDGGFRRLLLRVSPATAEACLNRAKNHVSVLDGSLDLEVVLDDDRPAASQLSQVAGICHALDLRPDHVIALPKAYLASYQPSSTWPQGLSPDAAIEATRVAFPASKVGGGMLTNFTEFNRCRPDPDACDYITHGNAATVHAADDVSVMQSLETLPHIIRSARAIGGDRAYRLGLTAIGMRTNPYGTAVTPNPTMVRRTMSTWDPRARALFGAAWAVGALAATEGQGVEAIALAGPAGPFGLTGSAGDPAFPGTDMSVGGALFPIYHALRAMTRASTRYAIRGLAEGVASVAFDCPEGIRLIVANLTGRRTTIALGGDGRRAILDAGSARDAMRTPDWLDRALRPSRPGDVTLGPYALVFFDLGDSARHGRVRGNA